MNILGVESSCDETGVALVEAATAGVPVLRAQALHSQIDMHQAYGGVVPELASRDHIRRVLPLMRQVLAEAGATLSDIDVIAFTKGPGLAGALLVGAFLVHEARTEYPLIHLRVAIQPFIAVPAVLISIYCFGSAAT